MARDHERYEEDLAPYLLSALTPVEAKELEEHLRGCASCREQLGRLRIGAEALARSVESLEPPASLRERVLGEVAGERSEAAASEAGPAATPPARRRRIRFRRALIPSLRPAFAQAFCLMTGLVLVALGVLGFFFGGGDLTSGAGVSGEPFIVFEVNGWHNILHLASGAFLLLMAAKPATAITGALAFGVIYVVVTVWGFVDGNDIATIASINATDNFLHLALAVVAILIGVAAGGLVGSTRRSPEAT